MRQFTDLNTSAAYPDAVILAHLAQTPKPALQLRRVSRREPAFLKRPCAGRSLRYVSSKQLRAFEAWVTPSRWRCERRGIRAQTLLRSKHRARGLARRGIPVSPADPTRKPASDFARSVRLFLSGLPEGRPSIGASPRLRAQPRLGAHRRCRHVRSSTGREPVDRSSDISKRSRPPQHALRCCRKLASPCKRCELYRLSRLLASSLREKRDRRGIGNR